MMTVQPYPVVAVLVAVITGQCCCVTWGLMSSVPVASMPGARYEPPLPCHSDVKASLHPGGSKHFDLPSGNVNVR